MHRVKCAKCGEYFDADIIPYDKVSSRRYAHKVCKNPIPDLVDRIELETYLKKLFNVEALTFKVGKQIDDFVEQYGYTYTGILKTLQYWYDIKKHSVDKAWGGIGIVPYIYDDAKKYYYQIYLAQEANKDVEVDKSYQVNVINVSAPKPQRPEPPRLDF